MQDDSDNTEIIEDGALNTLYGIAMAEMKKYIEVYLELTRQTKGLTDINTSHVQDIEQKIVVLGGIG